MKILLATRSYETYPLGGIEEHIYQIVSKLYKKADFDVVATQLNNKNDAEWFGKLRVQRFPYKNLFGFCYSPGLYKYLIDVNTSIIEVQGWANYIAIAGSKAAKKKKLPFLITPHELNYTESLHKKAFERFFNVYWKKILKNNNVISRTRQQMELFKAIGCGSVFYVPCGVNYKGIKRARKGFREKYNIEGKMILSIGRLSRHKRFDEIIEALPDDATLVIAGADWGDEANLRMKAKGKNVIFTGRISEEDKNSALKEADVYVSSSRREGFSMTLIEALGAGLPVISTPVGVAPELPRKYCILYEAGNVRQLNELIVSCGKKTSAPGFVKKYYSWDAVADKTYKVYESLL
jgi:glycosyltransferase involved in cell wall biosynthesis